MTPDLQTSIAREGREVTPRMIAATRQLFAPLLDLPDPGVLRDVPYGPDIRHRMDLYPGSDGVARPVLLFAGGGGYDQDRWPDAGARPDNVAAMAACRGMLGAVMQYRLAPEHRFPAGPEDVARAVAWLRDHAADHGGDPLKIVLVGHCTGATHVGGYLADPSLHVGPAGGVAGAILMSGIYDPRNATPDDGAKAYFGADRRTWGEASCAVGLLSTDVPLLFTVSELDPPDHQTQAAQMVGAWGLAHAAYAPMHLLIGHNHVSPVLSVGTPERDVEGLITNFVRRVTA
ncbi:alpha/beta hydrolase [Croceibacterium ferulae]|uniref:alpha/beta hydrolase n=1 Tax=Croceibacterium ferulae TaxID=1854641 RepID=UPI000EB33BC7|nr:alpha/beta hydrolase [Croceibacterium ferulae]